MRTVFHFPQPAHHKTSDEKLHLLITNFHQQSIIHVNAILELLAHCPAHHLYGLEEILYDPLRQMQQPLLQARRYLPPNILGQYMQHLRSIIIYPFPDSQGCLHTLAHELGHYVFQHRLDSTLRKQWVTRLYPDSPKVSQYASTNANEDFAESYACYLLYPQLLSAIPEKQSFMTEYVFQKKDAAAAGRLDIRI